MRSQYRRTAGSVHPRTSPSQKQTRPSQESGSVPISFFSPAARTAQDAPPTPQPGEPDLLPRASQQSACAAQQPRACLLSATAFPQVRQLSGSRGSGTPGDAAHPASGLDPVGGAPGVTSRRGRTRRALGGREVGGMQPWEWGIPALVNLEGLLPESRPSSHGASPTLLSPEGRVASRISGRPLRAPGISGAD